jgi:streptomycin 3"-adenylyltransferase
MNITEVLEQVVEILNRKIENPILGIYLYGSSVSGGLKTDSDIDLLVIIKGRLPQKNKLELIKQFMQVSGEIGNQELIRPLEITIVNIDEISPWLHPIKSELQYGEWLRDKFSKGKIGSSATDPDLTILMKQVRQNSISLAGPEAEGLVPTIPDEDIKNAIFDSCPALENSVIGDERNTILTLARMVFTIVTGEITSKEKAADWLLPKVPQRFNGLLQMAKYGYLGECKDNWEGKDAELREFVQYLIQLAREVGE